MFRDENFEVDDLISLNSGLIENRQLSVASEIERGKKLCEDRFRKRFSNIANVNVLYAPKRTNKPSYYYELQYRDKKSDKRESKKSSKCKHVGNYIIERDMLSKDEHDTFLAQPKIIPKNACNSGYFHYVRKRHLPSSLRCEIMATPRKSILMGTLDQYGKRLAPRQTENLTKLLYGGVNITTIQNVLDICEGERIKKKIIKQNALKKASKIKKKIYRRKRKMLKKIAINFFEVIKDFFIDDIQLENNAFSQNISKVISKKIKKYCGYNQARIQCDDYDNNEMLLRCIKSLSDNLTVWIIKILDITNFGTLEERTFNDESCCPKRPHDIDYPIEDYISCHSSNEVDHMSEETLEYETSTEQENYETDQADEEEQEVSTEKEDHVDQEEQEVHVEQIIQQKTVEEQIEEQIEGRVEEREEEPVEQPVEQPVKGSQVFMEANVMEANVMVANDMEAAEQVQEEDEEIFVDDRVTYDFNLGQPGEHRGV